MKREIRIIITGGRPFPNYQGVISHLHKLQKVALIYTSEGEKNFQNLKSALSNLKGPVQDSFLDDHFIKINAYNIEDSIEALNYFRKKYSKLLLSIDITSAPKIASLGAMSFSINDPNSRIIFVDSRNGIIHEFSMKEDTLKEIEKSKLTAPTIIEFLKTYGREAKKNLDLDKIGLSESQAFKIAEYFVNLKKKGVMFLETVRSEGMKKENEFFPYRLINIEDSAFVRILKNLVDLGLFEQINLFGKGKAIGKIREEKFIFLNGKWLDFYVAKTAERTGIFKDVAYSLEIPSNEKNSNEVDFIGILNSFSIGAVVIGECKTGRPDYLFSSTELDKLHSVSDMIGGNFVMELFVTNRYRDQVNIHKLESFIERASARNIKVILGNELPTLSTKLKEIISGFKPL